MPKKGKNKKLSWTKKRTPAGLRNLEKRRIMKLQLTGIDENEQQQPCPISELSPPESISAVNTSFPFPQLQSGLGEDQSASVPELPIKIRRRTSATHLMYKSLDENRFKCNGCDKVYFSRTGAYVHYQKTHLEKLDSKGVRETVQPSSQSDDTKKNTTVYGSRYYVVNADNRFACRRCSKDYLARASVYAHWKNSHSGDVPSPTGSISPTSRQPRKSRRDCLQFYEILPGERKSFRCTVCNVTYSSRPGVYTHIKNRHSDMFDRSDSNSPPATMVGMTSNVPSKSRKRPYSKYNKIFKCSLCPATYNSYINIYRHVANNHSDEIENMEIPDDLEPLDTEETNPFDKLKSEPSSLEPDDVYTKLDESVYICNCCGRTLSSEALVTEHFQLTHPNLVSKSPAKHVANEPTNNNIVPTVSSSSANTNINLNTIQSLTNNNNSTNSNVTSAQACNLASQMLNAAALLLQASGFLNQQR